MKIILLAMLLSLSTQAEEQVLLKCTPEGFAGDLQCFQLALFKNRCEEFELKDMDENCEDGERACYGKNCEPDNPMDMPIKIGCLVGNEEGQFECALSMAEHQCRSYEFKKSDDCEKAEKYCLLKGCKKKDESFLGF